MKKKGYCKSATIEEIQKHKHVLLLEGMLVFLMKRMMIPFEEKMADLSVLLKNKWKKRLSLYQEIKDQLSNIGIKL